MDDDILREVAKLVVKRAKVEIRLIRGFKDELDKLQGKIRIIGETVQRLAEAKDVRVKQWLRKAVGIIYDAEYLLDLLAYEKHRAFVRKRRPNKPLTKKIRLLIFAPLKRAYRRSRMGSRIRSITADFEDAFKEARDIVELKNLPSSDPPTARPDHNYEVSPLQQIRRHGGDTSIFMGRDSDVNKVVSMLCNPVPPPSHRLSVVAIVGFGGLGKTSLAKNVSKNGTVITHFDKIIPISDLKEFNIDKILSDMVAFLEREHSQNYKAAIATGKLEKHLGGKRYLLVLDDVWNTDRQLWDSMRSALESIGGSVESMILVTTRDTRVAEAMHASIHPLLEMSEEDSWSLFEKIAFENCVNGDASSFRVSGRKIMKKCKGVPLAITSIGGLLQRKRNLHDWEIIEKSELWTIEDNRTGIFPSLKISYDYLSSPMLKKCFSSCAFLPKSWVFDRYDLVDTWIALGLIQESNNENMTLEDIGERYLNELLDISFLFVKKENEVGEAVNFFWHDLARSVEHELFYLEVDEMVNNVPDIRYLTVVEPVESNLEVDKKVNNVRDIRHLTVVEPAESNLDFPDKVLKKLHSLNNMSGLSLPRGMLEHVKYLRVLNLERSKVEELPEVISQLKCLKLLNLAKNPIKVLPEFIMKLYNLQSLILYQCEQLQFPGGQLSNLVNLRHLGLSSDFCPAEGVIQQLSQLHTLPPLQLSEGGFQISELGCLRHIRGKLEIKGLEFIKSKLDAERADLSKKSRVGQLQLSWDNEENYTKCAEVLEGLCPHPNLKLLSIKGYAGDKFPSWFTRSNNFEGGNIRDAITLYNLIKIKLFNCGRCQQLPTLGQLGSLKEIEIKDMGNVKQIGPEFYCSADLDLLKSTEITQASSSSRCSSFMNDKSRSGVYFASLKRLSLCCLVNLEEWLEAPGGVSFSLLEELVIEDCPKLKKIPHDFPSLKELTLKGIISTQALLIIINNKEGSFNCLKKLHIEGVEELTHFPGNNFVEFTSLKILSIWNCKKLTRLPKNLSKLRSLEELSITWCPQLHSLPDISGLISLRKLVMFRNDNIRRHPEGLERCTSIEQLGISCCESIKTLPSLARLECLRVLNMRGITKLIQQPPEWLYRLPSLRVLQIGSYDELSEFPNVSPLLEMASLQALCLNGWERLHTLPQQLQYFTKLKTLVIYDFDNLEHLPDWLSHLSSLQHLGTNRCKRLKKLPSKDAMNRLTKLVYLEIEDCPQLAEAVKINGPEHHKIIDARFEVEITE